MSVCSDCKIMKKLLTLAMLVMLSVMMYAQKNVTKFLGIPVDGTKTEMIQKLKAKGFKYDQQADVLEGWFNGAEVFVYVNTNGDKVWRVVVATTNFKDEIQIRIDFNNLLGQFKNNPKYTLVEGEKITEDDDISYNMMVNKKRYEAVLLQHNGDEETIDKNKIVWFMIGKPQYTKYNLVIFYENSYNMANGEDL